MRRRRTKAEVEALLDEAQSVLEETDGQLSIRHLFYRLASERGVIPKDERSCKGLTRFLGKWRRAGLIPFGRFVDSTRWHLRCETFDSITDALERTVSTYRRDLWQIQDYYIEVWVEKDSMAAILNSVASTFGVPVFVCRGFSSLSSLYVCAEQFRHAEASGRMPKVLYFGDYDPSGVVIDVKARKELAESFDIEVEFERLMVNEEQIEGLGLPTRPPKKSDSRARTWKSDVCVELDAVRPEVIREVLQRRIVAHIEPHAWEMMERVEEEEKASLAQFAQSFGGQA